MKRKTGTGRANWLKHRLQAVVKALSTRTIRWT
jgi:hypothetical protein